MVEERLEPHSFLNDVASFDCFARDLDRIGWAVRHAPSADDTRFMFHGMAIRRHCVNAMLANLRAPAAAGTSVAQQDDLRTGRLGFRTVAPATPQGTSLEIDGHPDARTVVDGEGVNVEHQALR
jgi:hypothetical protein